MLSILSFAQVEELATKNIICIGESHYLSEKNDAERAVIEEILDHSPFDTITIALEKHLSLEYFINYRPELLNTYYIYLKERHFEGELVEVLAFFYEFTQDLIDIVDLNPQKQIEIVCYDSSFQLRNMYFAVLTILSQNKNSSMFKMYHKPLDSILHKKSLYLSDSVLLRKMRDSFDAECCSYTNADCEYLNRMLNTPFYPAYGHKREEHMFRQLNKYIAKDKQTIVIGGSAHLQNKKGRENLFYLLSKRHDGWFKKRVCNIGVLPKNIKAEALPLYNHLILISEDHILKNLYESEYGKNN